MSTISQSVGKRIKEYRKKAGITQEVLAEAINCNASFVSRLETGRANPTLKRLIAIADALHTPVATLLMDCDSTQTGEVISGDPRIRTLVYRLSALDDAQLSYLFDSFDLFIAYLARL